MRTINLISLAACLSFLSACGGGGGGGSAPASPNVPVNQAPSLVVDAEVSVLEGTTAIAIASGTDPENSSLSYSLSDGADRELFEISSTGSINFIAAPDFEAPTDADANNRYDLTVELSDSQGATDSQSMVVTVTNAVEGRVVDGPLSDSLVFIDLNNNLAADADEPTAKTDSLGYFQLPEPVIDDIARLVALGGTDINTDVVLSELALIADLPADLSSAAIISPLSSVLAGASSAEVKAAILSALGFDGTLDEFLAMDIWALAEAQDNSGLRLQRLNQQIALVMTTIQSLDQDRLASELPGLAEDVAAAIAEQISISGDINLQSTTQLIEIVNAALPDLDSLSLLAIAAVADTMADINELLAGDSLDLTSDDAIALVQTLQTELLSAVADLAASVTDLIQFIAEASLDNLFSGNPLYVSQIPPTDNTDGDSAILVDGMVADLWGGNLKFSAFDERQDYGDCTDEQAGTESCDSIDWQVVSDSDKGDVLQVSYTDSAGHAGIVVGPGPAVDLSDYSNGSLKFDIKVVSKGADGLSGGFYIKLETTPDSNSGEIAVSQIAANGNWESISVPMSTLTASGGLKLSSVTAPLVFFPAFRTGPGLVYLIDNVRFSGLADGAEQPAAGSGVDPQNPSSYSVTAYGAGNVADGINPNSYRCVYDFGNWIYNAGVVEPGIDDCNTDTNIPVGTPTPLSPQLTGPAQEKPTPTHKWWGSISFLGEMQTGNADQAAYITPDPFIARVTEKGVRLLSIPGGLGPYSDGFMYQIPDPFVEVFDGMAVGNTDHSNLNAYLKDHSDGSVTIMWKSGDSDVMEATFVHGSPYAYFKAYEGDLVLRTLRADSGEKGIFYNQGNSLGVWTSVAGNLNNFLITGQGSTSFANSSSNEITVSNEAKEFTLAYLPASGAGNASSAMIGYFEARARNVVAAVNIDYSVDRNTNTVNVSHAYLDAQGSAVDTVVGMLPLHWKNSSQQTSDYKVRSARGITKFSQTDSFNYNLPFVGVLPTMPSIDNSFDQTTLQDLVTEFIDQGSAAWNNRTDTYWAGKNYGKVAELAAIAGSIGMDAEQAQLIDWLKTELADWFTADTGGSLDSNKYFSYDETWNTLLGFEESFGSHQRLADHHFHYGYFVRAAAEICRVDVAWCGDDQYGPMIELLIRDYAADDDDDMFPPTRNFDPANGFSWADGRVNFTRGNNNESTSEAATAYGAIILYGLTTGNNALVEKGMYLHASTSAAYWEYWNNIDGYNNVSADADNFPASYDKITTSIIWGDGAVFSTWFSAAYAHILGIQGLPSSPLILHVAQYADYMQDYVTLGLSESSNNKPSGLIDDQWRDLWWNLWAMVDADAAIADYNTVSSYEPEAGETKAHTYHWIHTFSALGQLQTGTGTLTADYPAALAFVKDGVTTYVVYNFSNQELAVSFSDGHTLMAAPQAFTLTKP